MILRAPAARLLHQARPLVRFSSSSTSGSPSTPEPTTPPAEGGALQPTLPAAKLRALMSLYHKSSTFITPETLSQAIDDAFVPAHGTAFTHTIEFNYEELERLLAKRRSLPRFTTPVVDVAPIKSSDKPRAREDAVRGALWGVDSDGNATLETIEEVTEHESAQNKTKE